MTGTPYADITRIAVGDTRSCEFSLTAEHVDTFARLSADTNMLHMDAAAAAAYGFPGRVVHGLLTLSAISRLIGTELPGPGSLWVSQDYQFPHPVFIGDRLRARVTVEHISTGIGLVKLKTEVVNTDSGTIVLVGTARVKLSRPVSAR